jgi:hypothetical protein
MKKNKKNKKILLANTCILPKKVIGSYKGIKEMSRKLKLKAK